MKFELEKFEDFKKLVRMSPFLVATYMGKADEIHLEEEKVVELAHFEDFSLHSEDFTASSEIFLDLEDDDFHEFWEMSQNEILQLLQNLPKAANVVLGTDSPHLSEMLERVALQVARADGVVHDLEIAAAHDLEAIFDDLNSSKELIEDITFDEVPYELRDVVPSIEEQYKQEEDDTNN